MTNYPFKMPNSKFKVIIEAENYDKAKERFELIFKPNKNMLKDF